MVGLSLGEDTKVSFVLLNLSLLGSQSLWETLLQKWNSILMNSTDPTKFIRFNRVCYIWVDLCAKMVIRDQMFGLL